MDMTQRTLRGFTLVEVLVAMMVMAILAVMAWQGVDGIVRARDASQSRLEQTLRLNTVMAQWEQDLASVQDSKVVPALSFDGATLRAIGYRNRFVAGIVMQQAAILAVLGFLPGAAAAAYLYTVAAGATRLPLYMTSERGLVVFGLMLFVCVASGFLALRKVRKLDPAEVF